MYKTVMTDVSNLEAALNKLENEGNAIYHVLPHIENNTTMYVIIYRKAPESIRGAW